MDAGSSVSSVVVVEVVADVVADLVADLVAEVVDSDCRVIEEGLQLWRVLLRDPYGCCVAESVWICG
ncbi:hypothetical protein ACFU53_30835 [Streptomyces sp. NPDC057474]|uniref:hypothetical protein n=1 Tax=Streptomyces sp. NPDC057474 TaxID=3346144 RepID=UPI00368A914B